jgi:N-acetylmuramoyl-L-alanine amidase
MIIQQDYIKIGTKPRPGIIMAQPNSITIHWVGPFPGQVPTDVVRYWVKQNAETSAHFVIKNDQCINCIPVSEVAWHCGDAKGNRSSIGIEVIPMNVEGEFSADSIDTLKQVLMHLPRVDLLRHYDWTGKDCPLYYTPLSEGGEDHWNALREELYDGWGNNEV